MRKYLIPLILISLILLGASCADNKSTPKSEDIQTEELVYPEKELPQYFPEDLIYPGAICHESSFEGPTEQVYANEYDIMFYSEDNEEEITEWYKQRMEDLGYSFLGVFDEANPRYRWEKRNYNYQFSLTFIPQQAFDKDYIKFTVEYIEHL